MQNLTSPAKRNNSISYIKGCAILGVILIHMLDWCEIQWSDNIKTVKELLYPFVMLFIATAGSLMVIASRKYDLFTAAQRFIKRGCEIFAVYFSYSILKLYIYNFEKQPFYKDWLNNGALTLTNILQLKVFTVPITILVTIAIYVTLSPLILVMLRKIKFPKTFLLAMVCLLLFLNYGATLPNHPIIDFLYSKNYVLFPIALWLVPFLMGMFFALIDLNQHITLQIVFWGILTGVTYKFWLITGHTSWKPSFAMYPLEPYYISFSFCFMFVLIAFFAKLEHLKNSKLNSILATLQVYGDNTLELYIFHWIIIDCTSWLIYPHLGWLWVIIPLFFLSYTILNKNKINHYKLNLATK